MSHVVYELSCRGCNSTYVGQTSRNLATRNCEHPNWIQRWDKMLWNAVGLEEPLIMRQGTVKYKNREPAVNY